MVLLHIALCLSIGLSVCQRYQREKKTVKYRRKTSINFPFKYTSVFISFCQVIETKPKMLTSLSGKITDYGVITTSALVICFYNFVEL